MGITIKPEHNGAKNGGGYWGTRIIAKVRSKKLRRKLSKSLAKTSYKD